MPTIIQGLGSPEDPWERVDQSWVDKGLSDLQKFVNEAAGVELRQMVSPERFHEIGSAMLRDEQVDHPR